MKTGTEEQVVPCREAGMGQGRGSSRLWGGYGAAGHWRDTACGHCPPRHHPWQSPPQPGSKHLSPKALHPSACLCCAGVPDTGERQQEIADFCKSWSPCLVWEKFVRTATTLKAADELT